MTGIRYQVPMSADMSLTRLWAADIRELPTRRERREAAKACARGRNHCCSFQDYWKICVGI